jgi:hypothetical protein
LNLEYNYYTDQYEFFGVSQMNKCWMIVKKPEGLLLYELGNKNPIPYDTKILEDWIALGKLAGHFNPTTVGVYANLCVELKYNQTSKQLDVIRTIAP